MNWPIFFKSNILIIIFWVFTLPLVANRNDQAKPYSEFVNVHIGRSTYVAGESVPYKAYCFSNLREPTKFLSKVLYVELIDSKEKSVLYQVLKVENNTAVSEISLPDTLASGIYQLKAYTQWMKGEGEKSFFSQALFVHNQYDPNSESKLTKNEFPIIPELYIRGGKLVENIPANILIKVPLVNSKPIPIQLIEERAKDVIQSNYLNKFGETSFKFTPKSSGVYKIIVGDSLNGYLGFNLPAPNFSGHGIEIISISGNKIAIKIHSTNLKKSNKKLVLLSGENVLSKIECSGSVSGRLHFLTIPAETDAELLIELQELSGDVLTRQFILHGLKDKYCSLATKSFSTRDKVQLEISMEQLPFLVSSGLSVSVYSDNFSKGNSVGQCRTSFGTYASFAISNSTHLLYPRYTNFPLDSDLRNNNIKNSGGPFIEDLGILLSGSVENTENGSPIKGVDIMLTISDPSGTILASRTDEKGRFVILTEELGAKEAQILIYKDGYALSGDYKIQLEDKLYYSSKTFGNRILFIQSQSNKFGEEMENEAQRVVIQRVFSGGLNGKDKPILKNDSLDSFYGKADITVYPGDFFYFPNFEEIAREILPRVRYKHNEKRCELVIVHTNNEPSNKPIILIDGKLVTNHLDLYHLNSDDIQRIEMQSGKRVLGNVSYNGLLSVYTTPGYKQKKDVELNYNTYSIPGYMNQSRIIQASLGMNDKDHYQSPLFINQLYWNPDVNITTGSNPQLSFLTSDEEGNYIVEILGYTKSGIPIFMQQTINVTSVK